MSKHKTQISNLLIILLFLVWKAVDSWVIFLAPKIIPYLGFFPYGRELSAFGMAHTLTAPANFDGIHYISIAQQGYGQWEQAFFPLYPLIVRLLDFAIQKPLITGLIISNLCFFSGLFIFFKLDLSPIKNSRFRIPISKFWFMIFLLSFPTSFFFGSVYTEGLFFLLLSLVLYFLKNNRYIITALFAVLASLTRLVGVFFILPIAIGLFQKLKSFRNILNIKYLILFLSPLIGLALYCYYLFQTTGDPFFFLTSQPVFGANRSAHFVLLPQVVWRYFKIFITAQHNFQYYVSFFEFAAFMFVFVVLILDLFKNLGIKNWQLIKNFKFKIGNFGRLALSLFSFANLILPTLTGTLSSIPRYALFSVSFFLFLAELENKWIKIGIAAVFLILHIIVLAYFGQGYFVS